MEKKWSDDDDRKKSRALTRLALADFRCPARRANRDNQLHLFRSLDGRFAPIVLKNSVLNPTVIADSFRPVGAGDRIDDGSAAG
jgi:hypothetical protein